MASLLSLIPALLFVQGTPASSQVWERPLAPGMTFRMEVEANPPRTIYGIRYDPVQVRAESRLVGGTVYEPGAQNGRGTISALVKESYAQAGFNGDFFQWTPDPGGAPQGFMLQRGQLISGEDAKRNRGVAIAWRPFEKPVIVTPHVTMTVEAPGGPLRPTMLNGKVPQGGLGLSFDTANQIYGHAPVTVAYLHLNSDRPNRSGTVEATVARIEKGVSRGPVPGGMAVLGGDGDYAKRLEALPIGSKLKIMLKVDGVSSLMTEAMGGGPKLLTAGRYVGPKENAEAPRHPRTAMGITPDGMVWSVVIDGRQSMSVGTTLTETAEVMKRWGCVEAINLDGGGSSTLHALGVTLNRPSGGTERTVANGVVLFTLVPQPEAGTFALEAPESIKIGQTADIKAKWNDQAAPADRLIWTCQGSAWIDQDGKLHPFAEGTAEITVLFNGRTATAKLKVTKD